MNTKKDEANATQIETTAAQECEKDLITSPLAHDRITEAEIRVRRKTDLHIVPIVALLYLFCFLDRANIGNARLANFEEDLGLSGNDYNLILSAFYISYAVFEIPATLLCKAMGPGWFLPLTTMLFGVCTIGTGFVQNRTQVIVVRLLLGIFEAGLLPGIAYYLSRWYRRADLSLRLGYYMVMTPLAGAFGGLLASGILRLDNFGSLKEWRMIFAIEGILTVILGLVGLLFLTDSPSSSRWLSEEEKDSILTLVKSERLGQTAVVDKMSFVRIRRGFFNPITLSTALIFLFGNIVVLGIAFFLPTVIRTIYPGETVVQMQLRTVPPYILAAVFLLTASYLSSRFDTRQVFLIISGPLVMVGYAMLLATTDPGTRYAACFLAASTVSIGGVMSNAQVSANTISDSSRSMAVATNSVAGYLGGLIATWTYLPWDGPRYSIGNGLNLAASGGITIVSSIFYFWMKHDNKKRDLIGREEVRDRLRGLTQEQMSNLEWKHPEFRWKP